MDKEALDRLKDCVRKIMNKAIEDGDIYEYKSLYPLTIIHCHLVIDKEEDDGKITNPITGRKSWL